MSDKNKISGDLMTSAAEGNIERVKELIQKGADPNIYDAIVFPALREHYVVVRYLVDHGADVSKVKWTERLLSNVFGTPNKAVQTLPESQSDCLRMLLRRYFLKSKKSPLAYLKDCPDWHRSAVLNLMT